MASPSPKPSCPCALRRRVNSWNIRFCSSSLIPQPVSLMLKCSCPFSNAARSVILPSCVNFNALESKFSTICLVRNGSPIYKRFKGSPQSYSNSKCLAFAIGLKLI